MNSNKDKEVLKGIALSKYQIRSKNSAALNRYTNWQLLLSATEKRKRNCHQDKEAAQWYFPHRVAKVFDFESVPTAGEEEDGSRHTGSEAILSVAHPLPC